MAGYGTLYYRVAGFNWFTENPELIFPSSPHYSFKMMYEKEILMLLFRYEVFDLFGENLYLSCSTQTPTDMSKASRERSARKAAIKNTRMQEFNKTRDPIFNHIYHELVKTRKWVAFMGIILILSLIGTVIILMGSAALAL